MRPLISEQNKSMIAPITSHITHLTLFGHTHKVNLTILFIQFIANLLAHYFLSADHSC